MNPYILQMNDDGSFDCVVHVASEGRDPVFDYFAGPLNDKLVFQGNVFGSDSEMAEWLSFRNSSVLPFKNPLFFVDSIRQARLSDLKNSDAIKVLHRDATRCLTAKIRDVQRMPAALKEVVLFSHADEHETLYEFSCLFKSIQIRDRLEILSIQAFVILPRK